MFISYGTIAIAHVFSNYNTIIISDVVTIDKTGEHFRLIYDVKGRFTIHRISAEEAKVSLCYIDAVNLCACT